MAFVDHDDVVEALRSDRSDDSFDIGILPGRSRCGANDRQAERCDGASNAASKIASRSCRTETRRRDLAPGKRFAELCLVHAEVGSASLDVQDTPTVVCEDHQHDKTRHMRSAR